MNIIFLDFDGVINTYHNNSKDDIEKRIKTLSDICKKYNCKVVISSSIKEEIDEDMSTELVWVKGILELFKKYDVDCIGKTESISKNISKYVTIPTWKEDEIRAYLLYHPEVEHYCVIDDDDMKVDLNKVRDHLVKTLFYSENPDEEGLLYSYEEEIGRVLKKENKIRTMLLKYMKKD